MDVLVDVLVAVRRRSASGVVRRSRPPITHPSPAMIDPEMVLATRPPARVTMARPNGMGSDGALKPSSARGFVKYVFAPIMYEIVVAAQTTISGRELASSAPRAMACRTR